MSMVFAGFMGAAKEDRIRREDLKNEQDKEERSWQKQLDLLDITERKQQEILDRKLGKDVDGVMAILGLDESKRAKVSALVGTFGAAGVADMYKSRALTFDEPAAAAWDGSVSTNAEVMYNKFVELGYDATVSAGLVGNFMQESGVGINTSAVGDNGASIGAGQWNLSRGDNFKKFAASNNLDIADPVTAALFTDYELKTTEKSALEKIQAASGDPAAVAKAASEAFWRPGTPMLNNRMNYATGVFEQLYSSKVPELVDTGAAQGGLSFGNVDSQMAGLGLSDTSLGFGADPAGTDDNLTVSTQSVPEIATPNSTSLLKVDPVFDLPALLADATTEAKLVAVENSVINSAGTPEEKAPVLAALREQRSQIAALENNSAIDVWDPQRSPAAILGDIGSVAQARSAAASIRANPTIPDEAKPMLLQQVEDLGNELSGLEGTSFDPDKEVSGITAGIGSMGDVLSARAAILGDARLTPEKRDAALGQLSSLQTQFEDLEVAKAEQGGTPLTFVPRGANGMFAAGQAQTVRKEGGQWVDIGTGQPIDETQGRLLPVDSAADVVKQYNDEIDEIAITVSNGANGARDLLLYRDLVQKNPAAVNKYSNILGSLLGEVESAFAAGESWLKADGSYDYGFVDRRLNALQDLTAAERQIAEAQLGAALAVASASGSSGRDLSDNDLKLALQRVGAGISNPEKLVGLLNQQVSRLMQSVETQRSARVDSFLTDNATAGGFQSTPFGMPFSDYLSTQLTDEQKLQLGSALSDDRTVGQVEATVPPDEPQQQSSTGYTSVTPALIAQDARLAAYQGRQIKFVRRNGKVVIDVLPDASTARGQR